MQKRLKSLHNNFLLHRVITSNRSFLLLASIAVVFLLFAVIFPSYQKESAVGNENVLGTSSIRVATIYSNSLKNVYFTFSRFRYAKYVSPWQLRVGDTLYFKNYDPSKLRILQVFLYDYQKRGNQGFTKSRVTTQSMYVRTSYLLPTGKKYAYVVKFQDKATGELATKYFPIYTTTNIPVTPTPTSVPALDFSKPWTVANSCPLTTLPCVPCTTGTDCRYESKYVNQHGFRGWSCQNNNPGNIRNASTNMATDSKNIMIVRNGGVAACGVRYDSRGGSYFVFPTYDAGIGALKAYVKGISNGEHSAYSGTGWACGNCTLSQFFGKYAPGDSTYATRIGEYINEPTSQTLNYVVLNKLDLFVEAIKVREGFFIQ